MWTVAVAISAAGLTLVFLFHFQSRLEPAAMPTVTSERTMKELRTTIRGIEVRIVDLTSPDELARYEEFRTIHAQPRLYLAETLALLEDPFVSDLQKEIAGYAMQGLDDAGFLGLAWRLLELCRAGRISSDLFQTIVFAPDHWNDLWLRRGRDPAAVKYLQEVSHSQKVDADTRAYVAKHLLGG
ncbi:hypothetical protein [Azospirillum sp. TSH64]|uniref:hypothetical protein n=1 Tax=Azospirillum sp. TSH64 TaxID=652740 RepID=UPI000D61470F|nr:hypothetical protein [Azospirillum sp. TSH64]PWC77704.1 hypothetical protein TSH64_25360 [Azospirillum sp. TSH64]